MSWNYCGAKGVERVAIAPGSTHPIPSLEFSRQPTLKVDLGWAEVYQCYSQLSTSVENAHLRLLRGQDLNTFPPDQDLGNQKSVRLQ
ncbi:MAG: hypothetical protein AB1589_07690 [Cyanobacteriota bacterium]